MSAAQHPERRPAQRPAAADPGRPALAPGWRVVAVWTHQELALLLREPVAVFFSLAFPVIMYVFIGIPYASTEVAPGVRFIDVMFPSLILTVIANLLLMGMPIYLAELRSRGIDRRYATLPLRGGHFVIALLLSTLVLIAGAVAVVLLVVAARDGVRSELWNPRLLLIMAGSIVWLSALGFLIGALRVSARTTQALSAAVFFLMFFGSGAAMPLDQLPEILKRILEWNPLKQWLDVAVGLYTGTGVERVEWLRLLLALPLTLGCVLVGSRLWRRRTGRRVAAPDAGPTADCPGRRAPSPPGGCGAPGSLPP